MNARTPWSPLVLGAMLAAGCLSSTPHAPSASNAPGVPGGAFAPFSVPAPSFDFSTVVVPDHGGHGIPALHTGGHGLLLAGQTSMQPILPPGMKGDITQIDVWGGYAVVAGFDPGPGQTGPGFIIVDIKDPAHPKPVSFAPTVSWGWSARFSRLDGNYLFFACQTVKTAGTTYPPQGAVKGTCEDPEKVTGATDSTTAGVSVYDVHDKTHPKLVHWIATSASHNLYTQAINGTDYVFTNGVDILKFDRTAQKLQLLNKPGQVPGRHDVTVVRHPITGDWLLYTGTGELSIWNVNDPADPAEVLGAGEWKDGVGWHDQVQFPAVVDGRVLLALAGETGTRTPEKPSDAVTIVDITDPEHPSKLSQWDPPFASAKIPWNSYTFSVHEMAATPQGQLAVSWYHGGMWVLDVSTKERQAKPVVVAAYQPHENVNVIPSAFEQTPAPMVPFTWGEGWDSRGYLVVPDMHTGVYVLKPDWGLVPMVDDGA